MASAALSSTTVGKEERTNLGDVPFPGSRAVWSPEKGAVFR